MKDFPTYNPLDRRNLGTSVAEAMLAREVESLARLWRFPGAGIYAIYYTGNFKAYALAADRNRDERFEVPLYVGKAVPPGARTGRFGLEDAATNTALYNRLEEHAKSIRQAENLSIDHFWCRFLVTQDIWIPLAEALLVARLSPLWNKFIDGFGNHDPGGGRYQQQRSRWDVLHPGRPWADKCRDRAETADEIAADVISHLRQILL